jgi:hypothetical protein
MSFRPFLSRTAELILVLSSEHRQTALTLTYLQAEAHDGLSEHFPSERQPSLSIQNKRAFVQLELILLDSLPQLSH